MAAGLYNIKKDGFKTAAGVYNNKKDGTKMAARANNIKKDGGRSSIILKRMGARLRVCVAIRRMYLVGVEYKIKKDVWRM